MTPAQESAPLLSLPLLWYWRLLGYHLYGTESVLLPPTRFSKLLHAPARLSPAGPGRLSRAVQTCDAGSD